MTDYKGKVIDTCSDCGKRGPMWSGMPYKCKGCSDKMSKSNDVFEKAWNMVKEGELTQEELRAMAEGNVCDGRFCDVPDSPLCTCSPDIKAANKKKYLVEKARINVKKGSKPDYLDFDGDGDKKEPMKNALKNKKVEKGMGGCSICKGGALPCIGRNVITSNGVMCNNQVLDMTMG